MCHSGSRCPKCGKGVMNIYSVHRASPEITVRYLKCDKCTHTDKAILPANQVRRRARRS